MVTLSLNFYGVMEVLKEFFDAESVKLNNDNDMFLVELKKKIGKEVKEIPAPCPYHHEYVPLYPGDIEHKPISVTYTFNHPDQ